eukprot:1014305-Amphidinium_carterae.2
MITAPKSGSMSSDAIEFDARPEREKMVTRFMGLHELCQFDYNADSETLIWIHTTVCEIKETESINLGKHYGFRSGLQCLIHRIVHAGYGLSDSPINNETIALCFSVQSDLLNNNAGICKNGYLT